MPVVRIPAERITNWGTFHDVFNEIFGFPTCYGRNMAAWIDCLTYVDEPDAGMTQVSVGAGDVLTLQLDAVDEFARRCPEQYDALVEGIAFINWRLIEVGARPIIALAFRTRHLLAPSGALTIHQTGASHKRRSWAARLSPSLPQS